MTQDDQLDGTPPDSRSVRIRQIVQDCVRRRAAGESLSDQAILDAHPDLLPQLAAELRTVQLIEVAWRKAAEGASPAGGEDSSGLRTPTFSGIGGGNPQTPPAPTSSIIDSEPLSAVPSKRLPDRIGRYRIEKLLGEGGFGLVYLAHDEQLGRHVAVKVPHAHRLAGPEEVESYAAEARVVARLDHPHIVPVYDVGSTAESPFFVVSKYVEGIDLATRLRQSRMSFSQAAELVTTLAEALHYAHKQGLVHRDVKPGNILIGNDGKPFVVDFGLALREQDVGKGPRYAGTPAYWSPEQARGEGHRVDGRSDIFSLGVVFYELLVGRRPFRAENQAELLEQVTTVEARPPRHIDDTLPLELERICLKTLSKRAADRYTTAKDLAEDLRHFLSEAPELAAGVPRTVQKIGGPTTPAGDIQAVGNTPITRSASDSRPIRIVPKGLRSFDRHDADFFLELLPGPRDREGLPDSLRFWKTRIEETDPDNTFAVGLIYGPSGCGKSSLVKAGLLPRLSEDVISVYIEATPHETEPRLLHGLRKRFPSLETNVSLKETLTALRRGQGIPVGKKVLILLDQFEQWLHAKKEEENTDLVQALRQCDGGRVQCIVMVRDDFWLAVSRFLRELEVHLVEGQNSALADLFDLDHARKVLAAFGRAYGKLPETVNDTTSEQEGFLKQSTTGLAEDGKVICVRLALFAEMVKGKPWTPATLKEVGGIKGVGVTYLEETFSTSTAPPEHRYHHKAARAVLHALLPDSGTDIKGHMKSYEELLETSGYTHRPQDFDDLIKILDSEIRLITPTDPEGVDLEDDSVSHAEPGQKYYELTHDYLVHSLRDWLTRKQKQTRRGRAELLLADRATVWNARQENRQLPSLWQWISIWCLTKKQNWTSTQRQMMRKAGRVHGLHSVIAASLLVVLVIGGREIFGRIEAQSLFSELVAADIADDARRIIDKMEGCRRWVAPLLTQELSQGIPDQASEEVKELHARRQANSAVALLRMGKTDNVWPLLQFSPDPRVRSYLIHWISPLGGDPQTIIERLEQESDVTIRRALVLTLGEFTDTQLPIAQRQPLLEKLLVVYDNEPDAGLHGAAEWLLRKWGQGNRLQTVAEKLPSNEEQLQARKATEKRQWYVNTQGQTFVILDAGEFLMGSPKSEPGRFTIETQHRCHIGRRFAMSTTNVTKAQFAQFQTARPEIGKPDTAQWVKTDDSPQVAMTWYEAAQYCNWLSEREGIEEKQWCYEPNEKGEFGPGMKAKDKYLELSGYRLPTEAEWEYACRAGTLTSRYYGLSDTLLVQYAWYQANGQNRTWPVGSLKPNDFGLFDMQGNAWDWCDDSYQDYPEAADDINVNDDFFKDLGSTKPVINSVNRVLRGGAFHYLPVNVRSADRNNYQPASRECLDGGFRPARTYP